MKVTEEVLRDLFTTIFKREFTNTSEINQDHLSEWDSIRHLDIIMILEETFQVEFDFETISLMTNFEFILEVLNEE